jgi:phage-related protein (TIGR01555 family)
MSRHPLYGLISGLTSTFFSPTTGQGMRGADPAASVEINTMRPALTERQLQAWAGHPTYSRLSGALPGSAMAGGMTVAVLSDDGEPDPDKSAALQTAADDVRMRSKLLDVLRYSLRDGVAGLWLLDATAKDQREPLDPETARISQIHALARFDIKPVGEVISDAANPFYGWPEFVSVAPRMGKRRAQATVCHISRVVCVAGLAPVSTEEVHVQDLWDGYGVPLCRGLGETIQNSETGAASAAGLTPRISQPVIKLNPKTMTEAKVNRTMRELVEARLELARTSRSILGMFVLGEGESYDSVNAQITGFAELIKTLQDDLVLKWGMPRALVFGDPTGGLTASSAPFMDAWRLRVDEYRESVTPLVEYVTRCLLSTIGASGSNFRVEWAALTPANALQDAQADNARAQTAGALVQSGVLGPEAAADWLRSQGLDLPEARPGDDIADDPSAGEGIAAAIGSAEPGVTPAQNAQSNSATDAAPADSLWIGAVPAAETWQERLAPIRAAVAEILPGFAPDPDPHLTVLYLGAVAGDVADLAVDEAQRAVRRFVEQANDQPGELPMFHGARIALMSPGDDGRRAVALGGEAWGLYQVRDDLQAALGDLIAPDVRRFPWRPHVTLGYVEGEITPAQRERLAVLVEAPILLPIAQIAVRADRETPLAVLKTFDAATYQPPQGAQGNARKVLRWREEHGDDVKGMTSAGWIRASQLARGEPISAEIVAKIAGFVRFREDYEAAAARIRAGESQPWEEAAYVAWLGWGGDTGIEWARGVQEARRAAGK